MKKYTIFTLAPVLALLAVGCSSPVAMQSTEYDDMYYSSTDETVYVEPVAQQRPEQVYQNQNSEGNSSAEQQALADGEVLNPEYSDDAITQNYNGDEYYDGRTYSERDNWYRPSHSYVDPYWGMAYIPRRASYAYYDPFFDPFYHDPFFYDPFWNNARFGSGLSINISYGMGWGGFYGHPRYGYSNWWPNSYGHGFYNGYHRGYNNGFYAGNPYNFYQDRPVVLGPRNRTQYGPRGSRSGVATNRSNEQAGRPARGEAVRGERTEESRSREAVGRQSRSSRSTVAPETGTNERVVLPARPSRRSNGSTTTQPQEQRTQPTETTRPARRTREVTPSRSSEQTRPTPTRTRTQESSRPTRTYESRPSRSESRPVQTPTYERSNSSSSSSGSSTGSSSGGGRPSRRGNN